MKNYDVDKITEKGWSWPVVMGLSSGRAGDRIIM
jgi:hypothetical protein